ncbi:hypothetical protein [Streptomyces achromogenes]|uniref:hypothetical protein n=1 Tax=Streptomyces achromogenes TaxID=67255 RepID=UPI003A803A06
MTQQEAFASPESGFTDEAEYVFSACDFLLRESDKHIESLTVALRHEKERRTAIAALREEAGNLKGVLPRLKAMQELAQQYGITPGTAQPPVTLRVVPTEPERDDDPPVKPQTPDPPEDSPPTQHSAPATEESTEPAQIIIRSKRQKDILSVIATRPDIPWGSDDLARLLGIPQEPKARKALRNTLQALVVCGALERIRREDDRRAYYRPRYTWRFE